MFAQHGERKLVAVLDDAPDLVVDLARDLFRVVGLVAHVPAKERHRRVAAEHARAERFSLMPYRITIAFAVWVIFSRSFAAPVVTSLKTSSSAARPPRVIAISSSSEVFVCM